MNNSMKSKIIYKKIILSILMVSFIICSACGKKDDIPADADNGAVQETKDTVKEDSASDEETTEESINDDSSDDNLDVTGRHCADCQQQRHKGHHFLYIVCHCFHSSLLI